MALSSGFLKAATVAALVAAGSLTLAPEAMAFGGGGFGGGGFHGGGFGGGGFHGGGWVAAAGAAAAGVAAVGAAAGAPAGAGARQGWASVWRRPRHGPIMTTATTADGTMDTAYGYPSCSIRRVAVRTAWGVRWRTVQFADASARKAPFGTAS